MTAQEAPQKTRQQQLQAAPNPRGRSAPFPVIYGQWKLKKKKPSAPERDLSHALSTGLRPRGSSSRLSPSPAPYLLLRALRDVLGSPRHGRADSPPPSNTCEPGAGRRRDGEGERVPTSSPNTTTLEGQSRYRCPPGSGEGIPRQRSPLPAPGNRVPRGRREHPLTLRPSMPLPLWRGAGQLPAATAATPLFPVRAAAGAVREVKTSVLLHWKPANIQPERPGNGCHSAHPARPLTGARLTPQ